MRSYRKCNFFTAVLLIALSAAPVAAADRIDEFFGTWLPVDQPAKCADVADWGEGPQVVIGKGHFELGDGAECEDVMMSLEGGKLKVGGSCESAEAGYRAPAIELSLDGPDRLIFGDVAYNRCQP